MNKFAIGVICFISGAIVGGFSSVTLLKKKIMEDCEADVQEVINEAKEYYKNKYYKEMGDVICPSEKVCDKPEVDGVINVDPSIEVVKPHEPVDYTLYSKNGVSVVMPETSIVKNVEENGSSSEETIDENVNSSVYLISQDTYYEHLENYDSKSSEDGVWHFASLVYYKEDDKISNDVDDSIIRNWRKIIGSEWKDYFGDEKYGNSEDCVYVRNEKIHTDFLIQLEDVAYKYAILDYDEDVDDESDLRTMYKEREKDYREGDEA